jgi:16S rRNA (cytidine1402-2'-O)-methyltransferase
MPQEPENPPAGIYLVTTPIGNLEDISDRQRRILESCDLVACEDTRRTGLLLSRLSIKKPLLSYHDHNESARAEQLAEKAAAGEIVAVVSDAGTPGISDPAYRVVRAAIERGVPIVPIPGPSAVMAALVASGLPTDRFVFEGFLPQKGERRWRRVEELLEEERTVILFESPHRVVRLIEEISKCAPARPLVLAREITKLYEEFLRGTAAELAERMKGRSVKGECVLLFGPRRMEK